jgi:hypothetical protein
LGYSPSELDDIQARWDLRFPPDLIALLRDYREWPVNWPGGHFDWIASDAAIIRDKLDWPFEGFWFDVEHGGLWMPEWGERPHEERARHARLREVFAAAPKLIPLVGHRYVPEEPNESGNPVFSVYQSDIVPYGADLDDWLRREREGYTAAPWPALKPVRFWTRAFEYINGAD